MKALGYPEKWSSIITPLTRCTAWETFDNTLPHAFRSAPGEFLSSTVGSCEYTRNTDAFYTVYTWQQLLQQEKKIQMASLSQILYLEQWVL